MHEALLNVTQSLSGVPLSELSGVSAMQMTERGFVALSGGRVRLFDLNADKSLADASFANELTNVKQFSMNQHGRWLLTVGEKLQRWDLEASAIAPQTIYNDAVLAAAISSDGRWVVAQNNEGIVLWDCDFSTPSSRTLVTDTEVWDRLGVSRDGHHVVLQSGHSECQILTVSDDVETSTPKVRSSRIFTTEISHDGRWIAAGDRDGVRLYQLNASDLLESEIVLPAAVYPQAIRGLRFSQDSRWLFGWHPGFQWISRWDLRSPNASPLVIDGDDSGIHSLAISANGRKLAFGSGSGTVDLLDLAPNQTLNQRKRLKVHDWPVDVIALHPDGHCMATADWNTSVRFWDLSSKTSNSPFVFRGARDQTYVPVATSFDGRWIARVTKDNAIDLWDTSGHRPQRKRLTGHQEKVNSLIFADESRWLISHSTTPATQELRIWDLSKPNPQAGVRKLSNIVSVAAANNFGKLVAVDTDKRVKLFDLANQNLRDSVQVLGTHEFDAVTALGRMYPQSRCTLARHGVPDSFADREHTYLRLGSACR